MKFCLGKSNTESSIFLQLPTSCRLTSTQKCCACIDKRPHSTSGSYMKYVDGVGYISEGTRQERYCWYCKGNQFRSPPSNSSLPLVITDHLSEIYSLIEYIYQSRYLTWHSILGHSGCSKSSKSLPNPLTGHSRSDHISKSLV